MEFFDVLYKNDICVESGYIKKEFDEYVDDMQLNDRLRYSLAFEESEYYLAFTPEMRKEFIFHLFKRIVLGGGLC